MYGQMTAGSWIYIGTQGILQGTYECFAEIARRRFGGIAGRHDHADRRARRHGRRPAAGDHDERRRGAVRRRRPVARRSGASTPATSTRSPTTLDDAIARCTARPRRAPGAVGRPRRQRRRRRCRGCSTSTSRPTSSPTRRAPTTRCRTCPSTSRRRRPPRWPAPTRTLLIRRARESMADALRGDGRVPRPRRRGLRLRQQPAGRGRARRVRPGVRLPRLPAGVHPPAVLRGQGPVPLGRPVRRSGRHRRHRPGRARGVPRRRRPGPLDPPGRRAGRLPGPAGAHLLARLRRAGPARAALQRVVRRGEVSAPIVIGRDHLDSGLGGLAVPRDRGDGRRLRRHRRLAAAQRPRQHVVRARRGCRSTTAAASASAARSTPGWSPSPTAPTSPPRSSSGC